jgi:hypothetical protein
VQTAEACDTLLARCFSCVGGFLEAWDMFHFRWWQVRSLASGGCYEISYDIPLLPWRLFQIAKAYGRRFERTSAHFCSPNIVAPELAAFGFGLFEHSSGELPLYTSRGILH